ncbi:Asp-tRNA(Asn)/Glu-tRNA(Gln) amidotransferase subunit GatB [Candidatus Gracilibacteria bacterium]|nr:Asp-tRNA(Asn)/Glu-tRNA(Gln) amidotransferase subunit GatB [Candidatus Gracilibacteria bacterium]
MSKYRPVIGLEIHVQLNTRTKLFCRCLNEYAPDEPNKNICPFCTGQPGALPLLNKEAVRKAIEFGVAVGATIPEKTRWDRKNYFYPDLPAGYQISQYDNPIVEGGLIEFFVEDKDNGTFEAGSVELTRAHLEADAAKLQHVGSKTYVDFNRSAAPLIEIVTEPVLHSSAQAMAFVNELQLLVRRLGISDADMEKGQMRFDCNLSLQNEDQQKNDELPPYRTETKNINSVRSLGRAIEYEIKRQGKMLDEGETPKQETRGWKDDQNKSESQRSKEDAMDYRYFPEPDLKILEISREEIPQLNNLPELPSTQRKRYLELGLSQQIVNTFVVQDELSSFFDKVLEIKSIHSKAKDKNLTLSLANVLSGALLAASSKNEITINEIIDEKNFFEMVELFDEDKINNKGVQTIIDELVKGDQKDIHKIIENKQLIQVSDTNALGEIVDQVIKENPKVVEEYKSGKVQVIGFLIGQCMKASKGTGNPKVFKVLLSQKLK